MGDCGIKSGGAATDEPMLDQPAVVAVVVALLPVATMPGAAGFDCQFGAGGAALGLPAQGDETPLGAVALGAAVDVANGFDDDNCWDNCWLVARTPASKPSFSAAPDCVMAACVRSATD